MSSAAQPSRTASRSCDECRTRKTKCDRVSPCSHCRAMSLTCRTTTIRSKEHKDRIHVTKQYENKMDRMESRLANIERLLQGMPSSNTMLLSMDTPQTSTSAPLDHLPPEAELSGQFPLGEVGLRAESTAAKNAIDQAVRRDTAVQQDTRLERALEALRRIIIRVQQDVEECLIDATRIKPAVQADPTWKQVRPVLERYMASKPSEFNWVLPELKELFSDKCRSMYEHGIDGSPTNKLFVYSTLSNICSEFSAADEGKAADYDHGLSTTFSNMLLGTLATYPLLSPASLSAAEALLAAATTTTGLCKPSLTWDLLQTASRICQALGYNKLSFVNPGSDPLFDRKIMVFWSIYIMDRTTSLRLGRAPAINDDDIDTPVTPSDKTPGLPALLRFWTECARVQGKVSSQLYGPRARTLHQNERARIAEALAAELDEIHERNAKTSYNSVSLFDKQAINPAAELLLNGASMVHYSTATMALSAIPPSHPRRFLALDAARKCLRIGVEIRERREDSTNDYAWTVYCHWMLLHSPVTPFMSIFGHIIAHPLPSGDDLCLLQEFVSLFQPVLHLSEEIEKFHRLCTIFVQVAQAYVQAKTGDAGEEREARPLSIMTGEVDENLATLGLFVPQAALSLSQIDNVALEQQQQHGLLTPSLIDWYSGSMSLNDLLEQDFLGQNFLR